MRLRPVKIGSVELPNNLVLAPMSGVTNVCFRQLLKRENPNAIGLLVTEFISIEGLVRENEKSLRMMKFSKEEHPISVQIFGHDINHMVDAAMMAEDAGADILDINCGCPVPKVVKKGGGCELMRRSEHLEKMLKSVYQKLSIPLTLKIRSGWDASSRNALEIAQIAEGSGVSMLAIHGRTRKDLYRGVADWDIVAKAVDKLTIPVFGSGDVVCPDTAEERFRSGVAGLMIGRAALANPWVFSEIAAHYRGQEFQRPSDLETAKIIRRYLLLLKEEFTDKAILGRLKQFSSQVTRRVRGSSEYRKRLCMSRSVVEFEDHLADWEDLLSGRGCFSRELDSSGFESRV